MITFASASSDGGGEEGGGEEGGGEEGGGDEQGGVSEEGGGEDGAEEQADDGEGGETGGEEGGERLTFTPDPDDFPQLIPSPSSPTVTLPKTPGSQLSTLQSLCLINPNLPQCQSTSTSLPLGSPLPTFPFLPTTTPPLPRTPGSPPTPGSQSSTLDLTRILTPSPTPAPGSQLRMLTVTPTPSPGIIPTQTTTPTPTPSPSPSPFKCPPGSTPSPYNIECYYYNGPLDYGFICPEGYTGGALACKPQSPNLPVCPAGYQFGIPPNCYRELLGQNECPNGTVIAKSDFKKTRDCSGPISSVTPTPTTTPPTPITITNINNNQVTVTNDGRFTVQDLQGTITTTPDCSPESATVLLGPSAMEDGGARVLAALDPCVLTDGGVVLNIPDEQGIQVVAANIQGGQTTQSVIVPMQRIAPITEGQTLYTVDLNGQMTGVDPATGAQVTLNGNINSLFLLNLGGQEVELSGDNSVALNAVLS